MQGLPYSPRMDNEDDLPDLSALFAKQIALHCVRQNTDLEDIHSGVVVETETGDYSDVMVFDGKGNVIPWTEVQRISAEEMKALIKDVVNNVYTFNLFADEPHMKLIMADCKPVLDKMDNPVLVEGMVSPPEDFNLTF